MLQTRWIKTDYFLVAVMGVIFVLISYQLIYKGATISDEIVYAVVARNVVERGTLNTNVYRADSIVLRGYPTRDVHTPGYMLTLAAFFALFGVRESVAGLPSQVAYVLGGLMFYGIGKSLFKPAVAFGAALLFYIYPINFVSANLVLVESSFNLLVLIFIACWLRLSRTTMPRLLDVIIPAALLILGMVFRQTFAVFLLPTLFVLVKSGLVYKNYRPLIGFSLLLAILFIGVYWPLAQHRAYYPSVFDKATEAESWAVRFGLFKENFLNNFSLTDWVVNATAWVSMILGIATSILGIRFLGSHRELVNFFVYLFWFPLLMFAIFYMPVLSLITARNMCPFLLPGLWLIVAVIFKIKWQFLRYGVIVLVIVLVGFSTIQFARVTMESQHKSMRYYQEASNIVARYLKLYVPQTIMFDQAFGVAWEYYPVTLVWSYPSTYEEMQILTERLPIDAIVVNNEWQRDVILDAGQRGLLKQRYISLFPYKVEGYYFLINEHLQRQE